MLPENMRGEKREAKRDGAKLIPNSGRGNLKGDALWNGNEGILPLEGSYLIDYKHNASSFTLKRDSWRKHAKDAWRDGHYNPLIKVVYDDGTEIAILDWNLFTALQEGAQYDSR